jgi:hypothetical protein
LSIQKLSVDLPAELRALLKRYPDIDWNSVAEKALWNYALRLQLADQLAARSSLTETAVQKIGREIKTRLRRRYASTTR